MNKETKDKILEIAELCHEANKAYCELIGDYSQVHWDKAEDYQHEGIFNSIVNRIADPKMTHKDGHKEWMKFRELDGWVYGKVKDTKKKTHPCMIPYDELPPSQQTKDYIFHSIVKAMQFKLNTTDIEWCIRNQTVRPK